MAPHCRTFDVLLPPLRCSPKPRLASYGPAKKNKMRLYMTGRRPPNTVAELFLRFYYLFFFRFIRVPYLSPTDPSRCWLACHCVMLVVPLCGAPAATNIPVMEKRAPTHAHTRTHIYRHRGTHAHTYVNARSVRVDDKTISESCDARRRGAHTHTLAAEIHEIKTLPVLRTRHKNPFAWSSAVQGVRTTCTTAEGGGRPRLVTNGCSKEGGGAGSSSLTSTRGRRWRSTSRGWWWRVRRQALRGL